MLTQSYIKFGSVFIPVFFTHAHTHRQTDRQPKTISALLSTAGVLQLTTRHLSAFMILSREMLLHTTKTVDRYTGWLKKSKLLYCVNSLLFWATLYVLAIYSTHRV